MFDPFFFWGFPVCLVLFSVVFLLRVLLTVVFAVVSRMFVGAIVVSLHFVSRVCVAGFGDSLESMGFPHVCVLSVSEFPRIIVICIVIGDGVFVVLESLLLRYFEDLTSF